MDPAVAIVNADKLVTQANLPPDLRKVAFAEVLRYFLAGGAAAPGSQAPGTPTGSTTTPQAGWNKVSNQTDLSVAGVSPSGS